MLIFIVKQYRLGLFFVELQFVFLQPEGYVVRALLNFTFGYNKCAVWFYCDIDLYVISVAMISRPCRVIISPMHLVYRQ